MTKLSLASDFLLLRDRPCTFSQREVKMHLSCLQQNTHWTFSLITCRPFHCAQFSHVKSVSRAFNVCVCERDKERKKKQTSYKAWDGGNPALRRSTLCWPNIRAYKGNQSTWVTYLHSDTRQPLLPLLFRLQCLIWQQTVLILTLPKPVCLKHPAAVI